MQTLFELGQMVATPGALSALEDSGQNPGDFLSRHIAGDWGDICPEDRGLNEVALAARARILSVYTLKTGVKVWIITEADRASTCILLPSEY